MAILSKAWNNFKTQPDVWFFYGFLLTLALSVRNVLFFYPINGNFNEYTGIYLYLSDILLILTILVWIVTILRNKKLNLSSCITFFSRQEIFVLPLVLLVWSFLSISWSGNTNLALFRSLKLAEFYLLFLYLAYNVSRLPREYEMFHVEHFVFLRGGTFIRSVFRIFIALGFIQAIIGITQAILQHSVGLFWLKESLISLNIDGVANVMLFGHKFIRAYGLFPHPNILGGFLLVSIIFTYFYSKLFHPSRNVPPQQECSIWNILRGKHGTFLNIALIIQILALLLTFSKSAILGLFIVICYGGYKMFRARPVICHSGFYGVEHFYRYLITIVIILALFITILGFNINSLLFKSLNERLLYLNVSRETIVNNPIVGIGMGQFVENMQKYSSVFLANWQYQPVHNVFLLIWSELGIIGLVLFILFLWKVFHACPVGQNCSTWNNSVPTGVEQVGLLRGGTVFKGILLGFIIIMLFDHYLWDIQQGQIMLWLVLGLVVGVKNIEK